MSVEGNKTVATRWNEEVINGRKLEAFDQVLHKDYTNRSGAASSWAPAIEGLSQAKHYFKEWMFQKEPNIQVFVEDTVGEGDKVAIRGTFEREGKPVANFIVFYRLSDGKIVDDWCCSRWLKD